MECPYCLKTPWSQRGRCHCSHCNNSGLDPYVPPRFSFPHTDGTAAIAAFSRKEREDETINPYVLLGLIGRWREAQDEVARQLLATGIDPLRVEIVTEHESSEGHSGFKVYARLKGDEGGDL